MTGIVFYFEDNDVDVWSGREIDLDCWFEHAYAFDVDRVAIINRTDHAIARGRVFDEYPTIELFKAEHEDETIVYVCPDGYTALADFDHPDDCWYAFGPAEGWPLPGDLRIQTRGNPLHAAFVAPIVLHDRASR